ncbi:hypothetical protein KR222_001439, partial [Zaprionus bogoriensis]
QRVCVLALLLRAVAAGQLETQVVPIARSLAEQQSDGSYYFAYESADGSYREEVGLVRPAQAGAAAELEVSGTFRYVDSSSGQRVEVSYVADKHGFVPVGTHIAAAI